MRYSKTSISRLKALSSVVSALLAVWFFGPGCVSLYAGDAKLDSAQLAIDCGDLATAGEFLVDAAFTAEHCRWEFLNSLLSADAAAAARRMTELLNHTDDPLLVDQLLLRIAQYGAANDEAPVSLRILERNWRRSMKPAALRYWRAVLHRELSDLRAAERDLRSVLKQSSDPAINARSMLLLGEIEYQRGRTESASECFARVARIPDHPLQAQALIRLQDCLVALDQNSAAEQLAVLAQATAPQLSKLLESHTATATDWPEAEVVTVAFAAAPAVRSGGYFAVRLGIFTDHSAAAQLCQSLLAQGYTATVSTHDGGEFAVDVGRYSSPKAARRLQSRLLRQISTPAIVVSL